MIAQLANLIAQPLAQAGLAQLEPALDSGLDPGLDSGLDSPLNTIDPDAAGLTRTDLVENQIRTLGEQITELTAEHARLSELAGLAEPEVTRLATFHGYMWVALVAFLVTLCATPIMRRLALSNGIVDLPSDPRKVHRRPVAYLGGAAVFLGLIAGIFYSYLAYEFEGLVDFHPTSYPDNAFRPVPVPISVVIGMTVIMLVGLLDDIIGIPPWQKVGGQLFAAAALAYEDVGTKVAAGLLNPIGHWLGFEDLAFQIPIGGVGIEIDLVYWAGTAIIAVFVLGACNASNLIDGLDGLLSGTTAIAAGGLLVVALGLAIADDGPLDGQRVVLCMALLGACLGFLPHNFNPATIFLGDCGSLLLGFSTIVIILTLGDTGRTNLVFAGLFIYAIPIIDTVLAIVRRKLSGKSISEADDQHLHHMLKRALGVKGAVFALYGLGVCFATIGVLMSETRARVAYAVAIIFASFVAVTAIKIARKAQLDRDAEDRVRKRIDAAQASAGPVGSRQPPKTGAEPDPKATEAS